MHNFIAAAVVASNVMTRESRLGCKITRAYNFALNKGRTHGENETSNAMFNTALIARSSRDVKNGNRHIKKKKSSEANCKQTNERAQCILETFQQRY